MRNRLLAMLLAVSATLAAPNAIAQSYRDGGLIWTNAVNLHRGEGWDSYVIWADKPARALWFQVANGRIQFDRAEIILRNGRRMHVDLHGVVRGRGNFPLVRFGRTVDMSRVIVRARALTREARLGILRDAEERYERRWDDRDRDRDRDWNDDDWDRRDRDRRR